MEARPLDVSKNGPKDPPSPPPPRERGCRTGGGGGGECLLGGKATSMRGTLGDSGGIGSQAPAPPVTAAPGSSVRQAAPRERSRARSLFQGGRWGPHTCPLPPPPSPEPLPSAAASLSEEVGVPERTGLNPVDMRTRCGARGVPAAYEVQDTSFRPVSLCPGSHSASHPFPNPHAASPAPELELKPSAQLLSRVVGCNGPGDVQKR